MTISIKPKRKAETALKADFYAYLESKSSDYTKIDKYRFFVLWEKIKEDFFIPYSIQIVGTNGKGSTGRFLASFMASQGKKVFHYTSPHILSVNERFWDEDADFWNSKLQLAFESLIQKYGHAILDELSYFEFLTLLAFWVSQDYEVAIFEAGLGGEFDATSVHDHNMLLVTPVSYDHMSYLGNTIEKIARTKLQVLRNENIIGFQEYDEVYAIANNMAFEKNLPIKKAEEVLNTQEMEETAAAPFKDFLKKNLMLSKAAAKMIGFDITAFKPEKLELHGRMQQVRDRVYVDVGHNEASAKVITESFQDKKFNLIYNTLSDKDYHSILKIFREKCDKIHILPIKASRIADYNSVVKTAESLDYTLVDDHNHLYDEDVVVFGSFVTVEEFLKRTS